MLTYNDLKYFQGGYPHETDLFGADAETRSNPSFVDRTGEWIWNSIWLSSARAQQPWFAHCAWRRRVGKSRLSTKSRSEATASYEAAIKDRLLSRARRQYHPNTKYNRGVGGGERVCRTVEVV